MPMILQEFISQINESGILSAEDLAAIMKSQPAEIESVEDLSRLLVAHNKLTAYQAKMICEDQGNRLLLGNYLIRDQIGAGGMGDVYLAEHRRMERLVALKTLSTAMKWNDQSIRRFHQEVKAVARLNHPNIVTAYDADEAQHTHFLVMEYVPGTDLSTCVKQQGPFPVHQALNFIQQVAQGLLYAHDQGIIHRDIKPSNLLLDQNGTVKILDLGLARIDRNDEDQTVTSLTESGSMMGTIDYMSPEQANSTHAADRRSDIYSLGCSLYFLLTGAPVYSGTSVIGKILAHREHPIPPLCNELSQIPPEVDALYQKMIAKRPEDRFQTMQQVIDAIEPVLSIIKHVSPPAGQELRQSNQHRSGTPEPAIIPLPKNEQAAQLVSASERDSKSGTVYDPITNGRKGKKSWSMTVVGVVLLSILLLAGIVFRNKSPVGTVLLEMDQPDLAGAVVSLDDQQKTILKSGMIQERIDVPADGKPHTLKVLHQGYETFTTQLTLKAGEEQSLRVELNLELADEILSLAAKINYALEFDGKSSAVELAELKYDGTHPFTLEAYIRPLKREDEQKIDVALMMGNTNFRVAVLQENGLKRFLITSAIKEGKHIRLFSPHFENLTTAQHVAVVYDGTTIHLYLNGNETTYPVEVNDDQNNYTPLKETITLEQVYSNAIFQIGRTTSSPKSNHSFRGIIDEVRLSSVVRYTSDFIPEKRLKSDEHTMGLYHFDENGSKILKDASGHGRDGRIVKARWVQIDDQLNAIEEN